MPYYFLYLDNLGVSLCVALQFSFNWSLSFLSNLPGLNHGLCFIGRVPLVPGAVNKLENYYGSGVYSCLGLLIQSAGVAATEDLSNSRFPAGPPGLGSAVPEAQRRLLSLLPEPDHTGSACLILHPFHITEIATIQSQYFMLSAKIGGVSGFFTCNRHKNSLIKVLAKTVFLWKQTAVCWGWSPVVLVSQSNGRYCAHRGRKEYKGSIPLKPVNSPQKSPTEGIWNAFLTTNTEILYDLCLSHYTLPWFSEHSICLL